MDSKLEESSSRSSKPPRWRVWLLYPFRWTSNNLEELKQIFKMAAAPTIVVALIQSSYWVNYFKEFMYIMAIIAHACATPALPRAALINLNIKFAVAWALCYCWALLAGFCAVKVRESRREFEPYSASASAVIAMFLMVGCCCSYGLRSMKPQLTLVLVTATVFFSATMPALVELKTIQEVVDVASLIVECFYVGQAIGVAIGLLIFPRSSRTAFMKSVEGSLLALSSIIKAQPDCLEQLVNDGGTGPGFEALQHLKGGIDVFTGAVTKVQMSVDIAGQEWTYSHLSRGNLKTIADHLIMISAPLAGLKALTEKLILALSEDRLASGEKATGEHREFVTAMKHYADELASCIDGGIKHALGCLGSRASKSGNAEQACVKGDCIHVVEFEKTLAKFRSPRGEFTDAAEQYLMQQIVRDTRDLSASLPYGALVGCFLGSRLVQLITATGFEFHQLLLFLEESSHQKRRLYTPVQNMFSDFATRSRDLIKRSPSQTLYGVVFSQIAPPVKHDVDHLPPCSLLERLGDLIRKIWKIFDSPHTAFGARGALAIMTIAILAFLKDEHAFYNEQRFLWALFSIALCLDRLAGSSTLKLIFRFMATFASMVAPYVVWYICDQKTVGIVIFLFLWYCVLSYYQLKSAKYAPAAFTALVAATVMIANQLQVRQVGAKAVEASGQAVYPSYTLFPLRFAQVTLGIFVAYFWTLFPSPMPEHTELRLQAGEALLNLATFSTSVHQSISLQFGATTNPSILRGSSAADHLDRLRSRHRAHLTEHTMLIRQMQSTMKTLPYEFSLGGKLPLATYTAITSTISRLGDLFTLIGYISHNLNGSQLAADMDSFDIDGRACSPIYVPRVSQHVW